MTKREFLEKLKNALGNDLTGSIIQENVDYYNQYISEEVDQGRSEEEVISELGDPWVLAQTIIDAAENGRNSGNNYTYDSKPKNYENEDSGRKGFSASGGLFKMVLVLLSIIGVLIVLLIVVGGILRFIAPILLPLLVLSLLIRMFKK